MLQVVAVFNTCATASSRPVTPRMKGSLVHKLAQNNISSEDSLQLAVLAGAAVEGLMLVRVLCSEQVELASLQSTVADFMECVDFFFQRGGRMAAENSFVQSCMVMLSAGQAQVMHHPEKVDQRRALGEAWGGGSATRP